MINAKDLRIGNYFYFSVYTKQCFRKIAVQMDEDRLEILFAARNYGDFDPIPLSPELLVQCGFECATNSKVWKLPIKYMDTDYPCTLQQTGDGIQICRSGIGAITAPVIYLHQLQNLYFALTGTELTITM